VLTRGLDQAAQLLGHVPTTAARLVSSYLQRDGEKLLFVALIVAAQQCDNLPSRRH